METATKLHPHYPDRFPSGYHGNEPSKMRCLSCGELLAMRPLAEPCPGPEILPLMKEDGSNRTRTLRVAVAVLVRRGGTRERLLVVTNRKWGRVTFPSGKVHEGEDIATAALRELKEETGLTARSITFIAGNICECDPERLAPEHFVAPWVIFGFVADVGDDEPATEPEPGTRPMWMTREQLLAEGLFPKWDAWFLDTVTLVERMP